MNEDPISIETLLEHGDFVRGLAKSLIFDENQVDDVVQQTWLAWMKNPPRQSGATRGWLATVVRNLAYQRHRRESRREKREQAVAAHEAVPSTAEIVERESMRREIVEAALALDPELRDCIVLRYFENLPVADLAQRLQIPQRTAYTRLERGLDAMRHMLDARHCGNRRTWCLELIPLAVPSRAAAAVAAGGLTGWITGGITMNLQTKAAMTAALLLAGGLSWTVLSEAKTERTTPEPIEPITSVVSSSKEVTPASESFPSPHKEEIGNTKESRTRHESPARSGVFAEIWGQVTEEETKKPIPNARVALLGMHTTKGTAGLPKPGIEGILNTWRPQETRADSEGKFSISGVEEGFYFLLGPQQSNRSLAVPAVLIIGKGNRSFLNQQNRAEIPAMAAMIGLAPPKILELDSGERSQVDFSLREAGLVEVRVLGLDGGGIEGARVIAFPFPEALMQIPREAIAPMTQLLKPALQEATAGPGGVFTFQGLRGNATVLADANGFYMSQAAVFVNPREKIEIEIELEKAQGWEIRGKTIDETGKGVPGAILHLLTEQEVGASDGGGSYLQQLEKLRFVSTISGTDGTFAFEGIAGTREGAWQKKPEEKQLSLQIVGRKEGFVASISEPFLLFENRTKEIPIPLVASRPISGLVVDEETNQPLEKAMITFPEFEFSKRGPILPQNVVSDSEGGYRIAAAPQTSLDIRAEKEGYQHGEAAWTPQVSAEGIIPTIRLKKNPWTVWGKITDATGGTLSPWLKNPKGSCGVNYLSIQAFPMDPGANLASRNFYSPHIAHGQYDKDAGTFSIATDSTWKSSEAWVVLYSSGRPIQTQRAERGGPELHFIVDSSEIERGVSWAHVEVRDRDSGKRVADFSGEFIAQNGSEDRKYISCFNDHVGSAPLHGGGIYDLTVSAPGYGSELVKDIEILPGSATPTLTVLLSPEGWIRGRIEMPEGSPLLEEDKETFSRVYARDPDSQLAEWGKVDADGSFRVGGLRTGKFVLKYDAGHRWQATAEVDVTAGKETQVVLQLREMRLLTIRIEKSLGELGPNAQVLIYGASERLIEQWPAPIHSDGQFTQRLGPGNYRVRLISEGNAPMERTVDLTKETRATVTFGSDR